MYVCVRARACVHAYTDVSTHECLRHMLNDTASIITIMTEVVSFLARYPTDKGEHIALYNTNKNVGAKQLQVYVLTETRPTCLILAATVGFPILVLPKVSVLKAPIMKR